MAQTKSRLVKGRTVFHVGLPKTGTTYLQRQVFREIECDYAHAKWESVRDAVKNEQPVRRLDVFKNKDEKGLSVLSHEGIAATGPAKVWKFADSISSRPAVLFVVRNPDSWVRSYYVQQIRLRNETRRFPVWYRQERENLRRRVDYDKLYDDYSRWFGASNVFFLPYEMLRAEPRRFADLLSEILERDVPYPVRKDRQENVSLSPQKAELLRRWNATIDNGNDSEFPRQWSVPLRMSISRYVDAGLSTPLLRSIEASQPPIFRNAWEREGHLSEIWKTYSFMDNDPWKEDYAEHYSAPE